MKLKLIFAWYDFWVGFFYDLKKSVLYIFPFPMIGLKVFIVPKDHRIETVESYWQDGKEKITYIAYKNVSGSEFQLGSFLTYEEAFNKIITP